MACEECIRKREALLNQRREKRAEASARSAGGETVTLCQNEDKTYRVEPGIAPRGEVFIGKNKSDEKN